MSVQIGCHYLSLKNVWNVFQRADIAVGAIQVMAEREAVVDFSVPYYDMVGTTILMQLPNVPTSLFKFLSVLDDTVWGCIVAAYFVTRWTSFLIETDARTTYYKRNVWIMKGHQWS